MLIADALLGLRRKSFHRASVFHIVIREDLRVCDAKQRCRGNAAIRRVELEIRIAELRHPVIGIVGRMVDTSRTTETPIEDRYSEMIVETGEVGAAPWIAHLRLERVCCEIRSLPPDL